MQFQEAKQLMQIESQSRQWSRRGSRYLVFAFVLTSSLPHFITTSLSGAGPFLVTEGEVMLQDAPTLRGPRDEVSDGPRINILSPQEGKAYNGPVDIEVLFEQVPGGPGVKPDTLRVVYVKLWEIDITERLLPYLRANRIYVERAQFPPGRHVFRVSIADEAGKASERMVRIIVQ